jgi:AraC-like DNA-binding protein
MRNICLFYLFILFHFPSLIAQESPLRVDTCQLIMPLDIAAHVVFIRDNAFKINDLAHLPFESFTKEAAQTLQPDSTYWFRFTLTNNSPTTEFKALLFTDKQSVTELFEPDGRVLKAGEHTLYSESAIVDNLEHLPIFVPILTKKTYFLRLKTLNKRPTHVTLQIESNVYKLAQDDKWRFDNRWKLFYRGLFLLIVLGVFIFSLIQGRLARDKTYFFYALYLMLVALYHARNFENNMGYPVLCLRFPILYDLFEIYLNCINYLVYALFFRQFLDLPNRLPKVDKILRGICWAIIAAVFVDALILILEGIKESLWFYDRMRMLFFAFIGFYFYVTVSLKGDKLARLLAFGLLALILPAVVSVFENITHSVLVDEYVGLWRFYQYGNFHYGFYDVRIGILIEIACFSTALYYKTKAERQRNLETKQKLEALAKEYETLKEQQEQAEKARLEQAEKEAALKRQVENLKTNVAEKSENTAENDFILRGGKIIEDNLSNLLFSVEDLAKAMGMERGKFYPEWKKATGQTPKESIQNARLAAVQRLLLTTSLTISEIAHQAGFNEAAYLSRVFQQKFGQSPSEFRGKG